MNKLNFKLTQITFLIILSALLIGCSSDDPEPSNALAGTQWRAFLFSEILSGDDVFQELNFKSNTEMELFAINENEELINDKEAFTYTMPDTESFIVTLEDGQLMEGTINGNVIRFNNLEYIKL